MIKNALSFILSLLFIGQLFGKPISQSDATIIARNYFYYQLNIKGQVAIDQINIIWEEKKLASDNQPAWYAFNFDGGGFVIVAGDDAVVPVLGFSLTGYFGEGNEPPTFKAMMQGFEQQILACRQQNINAPTETRRNWESLLEPNAKLMAPIGGTKSVEPLLNCLWDQGSLYNALCPQDPAGPGGRVYAGCVATMMGMTIYYYRYPAVGIGSHGYTSDYGYLFVDFSQSQYNYNSMPSQLQTGSYDVAKLLYDCGVAVDMMYSPY